MHQPYPTAAITRGGVVAIDRSEWSRSIVAGGRDHRSAQSRRGTEASDAAEVLLKGPESLLRDGRSFKEKSGHTRHEVRLRWWDAGATTLRKAALGIDGFETSLPDPPVTTGYQYADKIPVFFGHYWLQGAPVISSDYAACLDFSVAKKGFLAAYRWSGESALLTENTVYVSAES